MAEALEFQRVEPRPTVEIHLMAMCCVVPVGLPLVNSYLPLMEVHHQRVSIRTVLLSLHPSLARLSMVSYTN
jgi:hypothetical protein